MTTDAVSLAAAFGYLTMKEVILLRQLAIKICESNPIYKPSIVNIGAGAGTSTLAFREGCSDSHLYSVDKSPGGPLGGLEGERNAFNNAGQVDLPNQILGDSPEVGMDWHQGYIDLLFIDGDHSYDGITADIECWFPNVRIGGYIAFHNYNDPVWPDVTVVVNELMKNQIPVSKLDTVAVFIKDRETL